MEGGPVLPPRGEQPYFELPFPEEELWYFSGGPHGGYGDGWSGWAALDFAPPFATGCWQAPYPVRAVAPGLVVRSDEGETWIDLDGDGNFRTGWAIFIMHLGTNGRTPAGAWVETGDVLGYPSCEGGVSTGAHLHIARMYDGQWMPANTPIPFQLGDWTAQAVIGSSYDGSLVNSKGRVLEACDCRRARKNRFPEHRRPGQP
jgi:murein DD-endopeptidase MepM/ murein hydrolase activator NlpD